MTKKGTENHEHRSDIGCHVGRFSGCGLDRGQLHLEHRQQAARHLYVGQVQGCHHPDDDYSTLRMRPGAHKDKVLAQHAKNADYPYKAMVQISGYPFYNTSPYTLAKLTDDPDNIAANFKSYIQGFSTNVQEILFSVEKGLDFGKQIDKMDRNNRLYGVVKAFSELDLNLATIDSIKMGYIFEELIRRFSENAEAGDHYTGRDIIKTMVSILMAEGADDIFEDGKVINVLDQACGTGGMLSTAWNYIHRFNPSADVRLFGQEVNPESYAMCLAEMLIKGQNAENIVYQDTMKADRFPDIKMRFVIENPPFGTSWGGKDATDGVEVAVNNEHKKV